MNKGYIAIILISLLIGYCMGYAMGVAWAFNFGVDMVVQFASYKGIDIEIDNKEIVKMITMYSSHFASMGWMPPDFINASIIE